MFSKVLIANRGEIAGRIGKTLRRMGIGSVAVHSDADRFTRPVLDADEAVRIGPAPAAESYLNVDAIMAACLATGARGGASRLWLPVGESQLCRAARAARHRVHRARPEHLDAFGLKHKARDIAEPAACRCCRAPVCSRPSTRRCSRRR